MHLRGVVAFNTLSCGTLVARKIYAGSCSAHFAIPHSIDAINNRLQCRTRGILATRAKVRVISRHNDNIGIVLRSDTAQIKNAVACVASRDAWCIYSAAITMVLSATLELGYVVVVFALGCFALCG